MHARGQGFESPHLHFYFFCGCNSVGRVSGCQSDCREFESRHPLIFFALVAQLVEHLICNQDVVGSIPIEGFFFEDYHLIKNDSGLMVARESR